MKYCCEECPFDPDTYEMDRSYLRLIPECTRNRALAGKNLYVRFMSFDELNALERGDVLENMTNWHEQNNSTSVGFCFMPIISKTNEFNELVGLAEDVWSVINNALNHTHQICVVFEEHGAGLRKSRGMYPDYYNDCGKWVTEYSVTHYSKNTMRPIAVVYYCRDWMYR